MKSYEDADYNSQVVVVAFLLFIGVLAAWFPTETRPLTAVVVAVAILVTQPWGWARTRLSGARAWLVPLGAVVAVVIMITLGGWDCAAALRQLGLAAAVASVAWLGSREKPREPHLLVLALALALLSLWAAWQIAVSFDAAQQQLHLIPEEHRAAFAARLGSGRAFASLPLPGHLAVLLATALPLLVSRLQNRRHPALAVGGGVLCLVGLMLTRSVIGAVLAAASIAVLLLRTRRRTTLLLLAVAVVTVVLVVVLRGDLDQMEPLSLRLDNWRTALWVWSQSPVCGVGLGGFGQASQAVPFAVGNQPIHAHCLPLEMLADLGPLGLGLVLLGAWWMIRLIRRVWPVDPGLAVAVAVVPLHNLVDFSMYISGVAIPWALLAGWAVARVGETVPPAATTRTHWAPLVLSGLVAVVVAFDTSSRIIENAAAGNADAQQRAELSVHAAALAPWRVSPAILVASTAIGSGDPHLLEVAARHLHRARRLRPHSASLALLDGRLALATGSPAAAAAGLWWARQQQPRSEKYSQTWNVLFQLLSTGDHATPR